MFIKLAIRTPSSPEVPVRDVYRALGLRLSPILARRSERAEM